MIRIGANDIRPDWLGTKYIEKREGARLDYVLANTTQKMFEPGHIRDTYRREIDRNGYAFRVRLLPITEQSRRLSWRNYEGYGIVTWQRRL